MNIEDIKPGMSVLLDEGGRFFEATAERLDGELVYVSYFRRGYGFAHIRVLPKVLEPLGALSKEQLVQMLQQAKARIADPKHWVKGVLARDAEGTEVSTDSSAAVCFCALGALRTVSKAMEVEAALFFALPENSKYVADYNDHPRTTHKDVMSLFDRAIALVRAEETGPKQAPETAPRE